MIQAAKNTAKMGALLGAVLLGSLVSTPAHAEVLSAMDIRTNDAFAEVDRINTLFDRPFGFYTERPKPETRDIDAGNEMAGNATESELHVR